MAFRIFYIVFSIFFVVSCAQVTSIGGGPKDEVAPKLVVNGINPVNETTNFSANEITFQFDEFITLNNPTENISIIPSDVKIKAEVTKKTMTLYLNGQLKPEQTYTIYMNGAVKDFTEGNDSLMTYVFSTGTFIDSISYIGFVKDAFDASNLKNVTVGLFHKDSFELKIKPIYFSKSNSEGKFEFKNLKKGTYRLIAFDDKNRDLLIQNDEKIGFKSGLLSLDTSFVDSSAIRMFIPKSKPRIKSHEFVAPSLLKIGATIDLSNSIFSLNGYDFTNIRFIAKDSALLFLNDKMHQSLQAKNTLIVSNEFLNDTIDIWVQERDKNRPTQFFSNLQNGNLKPKQNIELSFSDEIVSFNEELISFSVADSIKIPFKVGIHDGKLIFSEINTVDQKSAVLKIPKDAIRFLNNQLKNDFVQNVNFKTEKEYGSLILKTQNEIPENYFIEVVNNNKVVANFKKVDFEKDILLEYLDAGQYIFRAIIDLDNNSEWSVGDLNENIQAEEIKIFKDIITVRNNWEIEVLLNFSETLD